MSAKTESGHDLKPTMTLDMRGTSCPAPLLGAKRLIDAMKPGEGLLLLSDCPGTQDDLFVDRPPSEQLPRIRLSRLVHRLRIRS